MVNLRSKLGITETNLPDSDESVNDETWLAGRSTCGADVKPKKDENFDNNVKGKDKINNKNEKIFPKSESLDSI